MTARRIDLIDGEPDDVVIPLPAGGVFRLERMDDGCVWIAVYAGEGADRDVFRIATPRNGRLRISHEVER